MGACLPLSSDVGGSEPEPLRVRLEPDGELDAVPPVVRIRVAAGSNVDRDDVHLVAGKVSAAHLGQFVRGEVSEALSQRIVPTLKWTDAKDVVLAPTTELEPGGVHHVVVASMRRSVELLVVPVDPLPLLSLVWPPDGLGWGEMLAVWCGEEPILPLSVPVELQPGAIATWLVSGAAEVGIGRNCVHLRVPELAEAVVAPAAILGPNGVPFARLQTRELRPEGELRLPDDPLCPLGQLPLGLACVTDVADDRLRIEAPDGDLLWLFSDGRRLDFVTAQRGGLFVVQPLAPSTPTPLTWAMFDIAGRSQSGVARLFTQPPMAHPVITEVLANPVGPEPDQEFVELYNDGLVPADLGNFTILDIGGTTGLPSGVLLMPGAFALVVNEVYDVDAEYDPSAADGTLIVRVAKLGKGGLKNDGEPLKLVDGDGRVVSRFPPLPKPQSGISVQRINPKVSDSDVDGFVRGEPTPGLAYREPAE